MTSRQSTLFGAAVACFGLFAGAASAAIYTVTSSADSGGGTLRQAILESNGHPGSDTIRFAIPGAGVHTIAPLTALPPITDTLTIDGYSQPGSRPNTKAVRDDAIILIDIGGATSPAGVIGLAVNHDGCVIRGLAVHGFHPIGGSTGGVGIVVSGSFCTIAGNFVGTDPSGMVDDGNTEGVVLTGDHDRVGGTSPADRNLIGGSVNAVGLRVSGDADLVQGNFIGTDATGRSPIANHGAGIVVGGHGDAIGGSVRGAGNVIAFNGGSIIVPGTESSGISILGNSMFGPGSDARGVGGIDLGYDGVTPNDACDFDAGVNVRQNYPVVASAVSDRGSVDIVFSLDSRPSVPYRIEFFASRSCDASGFGQGERYLGAVGVSTDAGCSASATAHLDACLAGDYVITATATDEAGNTSEFSACVPLVVLPGTSCRQAVALGPLVPARVRRHRS